MGLATKLSGKLVNQREMSEIIGVSTEAIRNWVSQGCPTRRTESGARAYLPAEVIRWRQDRALSQVLADQNLTEDIEEGKRRKIVAEATLAEIEVAEKRGAVAEVDLIASEFGNALAACRARLIGVGASVAPRLSIAESAAAMKLIVDEAIYEALEEISDGVLEFARSPGGDDPAGDPGEDLDPDEAAAAADDC